MASSQFVVYSSSDPSGPGFITGLTGSLLPILDACLVNGYPGKSAAGWSKPIGNYSASLGSVPVLGCYKNVSGSGMTLFVNDAGGNTSAKGEEAWMVGFENITALTSSVAANFTGSIGSGTGQFPTVTQLSAINIPSLVCRKSTTADTTPRAWLMFADAYTMYLFIISGDIVSSVSAYHVLLFGDVFSLNGATDLYRCFIAGRFIVNAGAGLGNIGTGDSCMDVLATPGVSNPIYWPPAGSSQASSGRWMARTWSGGGFSVGITMVGDLSVVNFTMGNAANNNYTVLQGNLQTPNAPDNSYYLAPLRIGEIGASGVIRGRFRGLYHVCHPAANFSDGQRFSGAGDFAGKTFQVIKPLINNGFFAIETSNTVETN